MGGLGSRCELRDPGGVCRSGSSGRDERVARRPPSIKDGDL